MDRRDFIKMSSIGLAGLSLPGILASARGTKPEEEKYSIVILGDTHYDAADPEYYHAGYYDPDPKRESVHLHILRALHHGPGPGLLQQEPILLQHPGRCRRR